MTAELKCIFLHEQGSMYIRNIELRLTCPREMSQDSIVMPVVAREQLIGKVKAMHSGPARPTAAPTIAPLNRIRHQEAIRRTLALSYVVPKNIGARSTAMQVRDIATLEQRAGVCIHRVG